jgi:hypothetical protein
VFSEVKSSAVHDPESMSQLINWNNVIAAGMSFFITSLHLVMLSLIPVATHLDRAGGSFFACLLRSPSPHIMFLWYGLKLLFSSSNQAVGPCCHLAGNKLGE